MWTGIPLGGTMVTKDELAKKYEEAKEIHESFNNEKIKLESALETYKKDYNEKLEALLQLTGAESYEDAVKLVKKDKAKLEKDSEKLEAVLDTYIKSYESGSDSE